MAFTYWLGYDAQDVSFRYRENLPLVLQKLCLQLTPGQRVGVVGRTGSGKSTLLRRGEKPIGKNIAEKKNRTKKMGGTYFDATSCRILLRTVEPSEGSVTIDGVDIQKVGLARLRSSVTAIPQDGDLLGELCKNIYP